MRSKSKTRKVTRRRRQIGGSAEQIQHCISQLKRFAERAKEGKVFNSLQFGYNLGRIQEMVNPEPGANKKWWKPVETLVESKDWTGLSAKIDELKPGDVEYDMPTVNKP
jgi:hypothetical protein